jgi:hypothetical protein
VREDPIVRADSLERSEAPLEPGRELELELELELDPPPPSALRDGRDAPREVSRILKGARVGSAAPRSMSVSLEALECWSVSELLGASEEKVPADVPADSPDERPSSELVPDPLPSPREREDGPLKKVVAPLESPPFPVPNRNRGVFCGFGPTFSTFEREFGCVTSTSSGALPPASSAFLSAP